VGEWDASDAADQPSFVGVSVVAGADEPNGVPASVAAAGACLRVEGYIERRPHAAIGPSIKSATGHTSPPEASTSPLPVSS